jgi:ADP-L-glycero-D-manno-heptose 6-epimerase
MKILITGHLGFIGKNLYPFLVSKGYKVDGYDLATSPNHFPKVYNYDWVIHLGANSNTTEKDLNKILKQNFEFSVRLFEGCVKHNVKFQYASSASVYGLESNFIEDQFCKPVNPYAFSKYMFDCFLSLGAKQYQGFRYFNVYGNGEDDKGSQSSPIWKFMKQSYQEEGIKVFKDSEKYLRDFICVEDICEMHLKFLKRPDLVGVWNIGTSKPISFLDVAKIIQEKNDCKITEIDFPEELKNQYQEFTCADLTKLNKDIGKYEWKTVKQWVNSIYEN